MSTAPIRKLTAEQYLEIERKAEFKSEFFRGEMFAMAGASHQHNRISRNLIARIDEHLREGPCEVYGSDMRVRVERTGLHTYPDVVIACGELQFSDSRGDTLSNPKVLIEILSDSTEKYDRGTRSMHYREIESLQEHVLVCQDRPHVEAYQRQPDGNWLLREARDLASSITLHSIGITLPLSEVFHRVELPPREHETGEMKCSDP